MKPASKTPRRAPNGVLSDKPIPVRLLPAERNELEELAKREQRSLASVSRLVLLRGLADCRRTKTLTV